MEEKEAWKGDRGEGILCLLGVAKKRLLTKGTPRCKEQQWFEETGPRAREAGPALANGVNTLPST